MCWASQGRRNLSTRGAKGSSTATKGPRTCLSDLPAVLACATRWLWSSVGRTAVGLDSGRDEAFGEALEEVVLRCAESFCEERSKIPVYSLLRIADTQWQHTANDNAR